MPTENQVSALDWLAHPEKLVPKGVCAVFGEESFLRRTVLAKIPSVVAESLQQKPDALTPAEFNGSVVPWKEVVEELTTFTLFGPPCRLVILNNADDFITKNRELLEKYTAEPAEMGILVMELKSFPANTRLYKLVEGNGTLISCNPLNERGELPAWVCETAKKKYKFTIQPSAAALLVSQIGTEMGILDQELGKLALSVEKDQPVTEVQVRQNCGTWRTQTIWTLVDCILDGRAKEALQYLGQLIDSGEDPNKILPQISSSLRRLATALRIVLEEERMGRRPNLNAILTSSGVKSYYVQKTANQLRRLGRERGKKLLPWLVELDFQLKGESAISDRLLLERFILRLMVPAKK
ncbi:MAG: DNA polymerase III subunit delta [Thermoguttaceae bacterium]|nr:DNA polymerase III subunit delta [Thermoguttaceae bacterium]MDO4858404.1 DNA polymerase III subunit delta [Thermoguttaceae bacterium]